FVQNGGDAILTGQNNNWVCLGESNGNATYEMNGGYLEAQNGVYLSHTGAASAMFIMKGGTVVVPTFVEGTSAANSTLVLGGGTIKAAADGATIFNNIDNIIYSGDFTLDTNGKNAGISGIGSETALSGSKFTKAGEGTLTAAAIPAASTVKVAAGTLALSNGGDNTAARVESLAHRWSFNDGTLADSVTGSADGTRNVGDNEISGGMLHLPGGYKNTKHVDLGANPITTDSATLEFWFTPRANTVWPKMFCLGANSGNVVAFTTFRTSNGGPSGIDVGPNGGTWTGTGTLSTGVKYHLAVVFDYDSEAGSTTLRAYCFDTTTGLLAGTIEQTLANWRFTEKITQNYFCLGYSFWNDRDANIDYDEVRVWNTALTRTEIERNLATGPDAAFETGDTVRKIELASGGTLDLGGNTLRQPTIALGGGTLRNGTLVVTGTIDLHVGDSIVNTGTIDLSGATVNLVDPENLDGTYTFISGSGTVTGKPAAVNVPNGWTVGVAGGKACIRKTGIAVIVW
ncbi:MAG: hypothetical protein IIT98_07215, partial [Kiritimatiellae bacterium]|nr:hypothetical protein [Kiritimatiellia bacterium]